jgi:hypothetical protein
VERRDYTVKDLLIFISEGDVYLNEEPKGVNTTLIDEDTIYGQTVAKL